MTEQEYAQKVAARFGRGVLPSWETLAKRENRAMWLRNGNPHKTEVTQVAKTTAADAMRATWQAKVEEARQEVIRILDRPMTTGDVARALGIANQHTAHTRLLRMAEQGFIALHKVKGMAVWQRKQEAAE